MRRQFAVVVSSVADARIDSFLRLAFSDSYCANCKVIYEQFLISMMGRKPILKHAQPAHDAREADIYKEVAYEY